MASHHHIEADLTANDDEEDYDPEQQQTVVVTHSNDITQTQSLLQFL